jgi:hypothetical protein
MMPKHRGRYFLLRHHEIAVLGLQEMRNE